MGKTLTGRLASEGNGLASRWSTVTRRVLQGFSLAPVMLNISPVIWRRQLSALSSCLEVMPKVLPLVLYVWLYTQPIATVTKPDLQPELWSAHFPQLIAGVGWMYCSVSGPRWDACVVSKKTFLRELLKPGFSVKTAYGSSWAERLCQTLVSALHLRTSRRM